MKKIIPLFVLIFFIISAAAVTAGDRKRPEGDQRNRWSGFLSSLEGLDLTDEQSKKITDLYKASRDKSSDTKNDLLKKRAELDLMWMEADLDADKIRAAQQKVNEMRGQIQNETMEFRLAYRAVLTPEQSEKYVTMQKAKRRRHQPSQKQ